jgi:ketosteroid isomerase-like protein
MVRFPRLVVRGSRLFGRLDPTSPVRRPLLRRAVRSGWAGISRQDIELVLTRYADDVVQEWPPDFVALGMPSRLEGKAAWLEAWRGFMEAWEDYRLIPSALVDAGDRILVLGRIEARGRSSGAGIDFLLGQLIDADPHTGLVLRERFFTDWHEAARAAGIDSSVISSLEALEPGAALTISHEPKP